jgi:hypothetical protein
MTTESLRSVNAATPSQTVRSRIGVVQTGCIGIRRDGRIALTEIPSPAPHYASLEMSPDPAEVSGARHWAEFVTAGWNVAVNRDAVGVVVSELLANAIAACAADTPVPQPLLIQLLLDSESLCIAIRDDHPFTVPNPVRARDDDEHGRGLHLVHTLCTAWGWYATSQAKIVWGELSTTKPEPASRSAREG